MKTITFVCLLHLALYQSPAFAYLDPGTGSMLLSAMIGIVATVFFFLKTIYYKISGGMLSLLGIRNKNRKHGLVFYSEGKSYWHTFQPILEALNQRGINAVYLTSSLDDKGLKFKSDTIECKYIGEGNKAYAQLNMLEADVCVMTTPGLDVLQIHRSKGVKHYAHVVHAPTDVGLYKLYSFDYYDSVLCSGKHQIKSLRHLENLRGTTPKLLKQSGCPYMDTLAKQVEKPTHKFEHQAKPHILIAPTWGNNGLLKRFGMELLEPLAECGYFITIRPHPQSYISELDLVESLQSKLKNKKNIVWDNSADNFTALCNSDVMISDLSGVIFDYALVFEKPVITVQFDVNLIGTEANDLPDKVWELKILEKIGKQISISELDKLPMIIESLLSNNDFKSDIVKLRDENLYNYRNAGEVIASQLVEILTDVKANHIH